MTQKKKKLKPLVEYELDVQFWAGSVRVKARTESEARRKAWEKLKKNPKVMLKWINKKNSYVDKLFL